MAVGRSRNSARLRAAAVLNRERFPGAAGRTGAAIQKKRLSPAALRRLVTGSLWMMLAAEALLAARYSPWFEVRQVRLVGVASLAPDEVAILQKAWELPRGTNVFEVLWRRRGAAAAKFPFVASVRVGIAGIHAVRVLVRPRIPVGVVQCGSSCWEVDRQGWVVRPARSNNRLPVIEVEDGAALRPGTMVPNEAAVEALKTVWPAMAGGLSVAKVHVDPHGNLCLNMVDGVTVQMGQPDQLDAKLRMLERIYRKEAGIGQRVSAINLSCVEAPACTPRAPATAHGGSSGAQAQAPGNAGPQHRAAAGVQ